MKRQSKDLCAIFELRAKNAPICNSLPRHFYENLHEYLNVSYLIISLNKKNTSLIYFQNKLQYGIKK